MKVIFLDIDGVLALCCQTRDKYGSLFHPHFIDNLKTIIDQTNAKIVISSTWRFSGLSVMKSMWIDRNLPGEVIDITPNLTYGEINNYCRGDEIDKWLSLNKVDNYVIIDDDKDMLKNQMNNFVCTYQNYDHSDYLDDGYGLTKECALKAIQILNNQ